MRTSILSILIIFGVVMLASPSFAVPVYKVDKVHSTVGFTVTHLMVSKVTGSFPDFEDDVAFGADDLSGSRFNFKIKVAGIDTRNEQRDKHLRSGDFFDAEKYPLIQFVTKKVANKGNGDYLVTGDLTIKDVTKEAEIPVKITGPVKNPMGPGTIMGVEANFSINRQDYHVSWNKTLDNGGVVISDTVQLAVNLEAHGE